MRFWDASALVPLLVEEPATGAFLDLHRADPVSLVWWGSVVECASAIARLEWDGDFSPAAAAESFRRLEARSATWHEIQPLDEVRETAVRFLRVRGLRAFESLQFAAAFVAAERRPPSLEFVCLDQRLATASEREGFRIVSV
jgi:hypothetical protein